MATTQAMWKLDEHTRAKHVILRKYLDAWLPIMATRNQRIVFCDGFAGPGRYEGGQEGSPLIAINALLEHPHRTRIASNILYVFIEAKKKRFDALRENLESLGPLPSNLHVHPIHGEYEPAFTQMLDELGKEGLSLAPTFAFIDPFGLKGLPLRLIARMMAHKSCEVLINVMLSCLHRFVTEPELESVSDELFGCERWREARGLQGDAREIFLRELYQSRLQDAQTGVGAKYVRFFTMKDWRNRTIYDLFFATNHRLGIDKMKDAMWKVDDSGSFQFSDRTVPGQEVLFAQRPDWDALITSLCKEFKGQTVGWSSVEESIRRSPFRILKEPIKAAAKESNACLEILNPAGSRKNTINKDTRIRFR